MQRVLPGATLKPAVRLGGFDERQRGPLRYSEEFGGPLKLLATAEKMGLEAPSRNTAMRLTGACAPPCQQHSWMETSYASIDDEKYRLPIQRPWLTLLIDVATRMVGGYYLSLDPPSSG